MSVPAHEIAGEGGPTVVMLHGLGGGRMSFEPQMAALSDRYRLVAWDMPGYGQSRPLPQMTWTTLAQAAVALIDHLGVAEVDLLGHSMGGMIAQEVVASYPDRVRRLVLAGTNSAFGSGEFRTQFLAQRLAPIEAGKTPGEIAPALIAGMVGEDPDPEATQSAIASMQAIPPQAYRQALECLVTFDRRAALERIAKPTLLIAGGKDKVAPPGVMQRMASTIRGSRYQEIAGAGHLLYAERPVAFTAALAQFLDAP